ncbi:MAG: hypothetical protein ABSC22_00645 [Roseiarcus sp.]|jgi:hypothetical protein
MRVSVKYDEQPSGARRTDVYLILTIEFSDEERQTIRQRNLENIRIVGLPLDPWLVSPRIKKNPFLKNLPYIGFFFFRPYCVLARELLIYKTFVYKFADANSAKQVEAEARASLVELKNRLLADKDVGRDEVYDL